MPFLSVAFYFFQINTLLDCCWTVTSLARSMYLFQAVAELYKRLVIHELEYTEG